MPTSPPALARPSPRAPERRVDLVVDAVAVALAAVLLAVASVALADPARVDVVVDNPTAYDVHVDVRSADGGNRLGLGTVAAGESRPFRLVVDRGDRWHFEFSRGRVDASPVEVSRDAVRAGPVVVPASVEAEFRAAGLRPLRF